MTIIQPLQLKRLKLQEIANTCWQRAKKDIGSLPRCCFNDALIAELVLCPRAESPPCLGRRCGRFVDDPSMPDLECQT